MISIYEDQAEFIDKIRKVWKSHKRILGCSPTGSGKTRIAAKIIEGLVRNKMSVCFIVPRITLVGQTVREFNKLGLEDITVIHRDAVVDHNALITVASIDTYIRRDKREFDLVIIDEAHKIKKKLLKWMDEHPDERYLGLTATPFANWMGNYFSVLVKGKSVKWLIENGRLAPFECYAPHIPDLKKAKFRMNSCGEMDFVESELEAVMGDAKVCDDVVAFWLANGENKLTVGLAVNKKHAHQMSHEFNRAGVMSEVITAETPIDQREIIFKRMKDGITRVIWSVDCLTEGFDMPEVEVLINARPTKSISRWSQGAGRCLRFVEGKTAKIFDHSGTALTLGLPDEIEIDELRTTDKSTESRKVVREKTEREKKEKLCGKCSFLKPAGVAVCPRCGHISVLREDVESDPTIKLEKIKGKKKEYSVEEKQEFYGMLIYYANSKGYKAGWSFHKYLEKFGVQPHSKLKKNPVEPTPEFNNYIRHINIRNAKSFNKRGS